jgi:hypothetical protein
VSPHGAGGADLVADDAVSSSATVAIEAAEASSVRQ